MFNFGCSCCVCVDCDFPGLCLDLFYLGGGLRDFVFGVVTLSAITSGVGATRKLWCFRARFCRFDFWGLPGVVIFRVLWNCGFCGFTGFGLCCNVGFYLV